MPRVGFSRSWFGLVLLLSPTLLACSQGEATPHPSGGQAGVGGADDGGAAGATTGSGNGGGAAGGSGGGTSGANGGGTSGAGPSGGAGGGNAAGADGTGGATTGAGGAASGGSGAAGASGAAGTRCTSMNAVFHSSGDQTQCNSSGQGDPNGQHNFSNTWDVYDNMWNCTASCTPSNTACQTLAPESIYVCSTSSWFVTSAQWSQGGAVMTFPGVQYNFSSGKGTAISNYTSMASTFTEVSPHVGIYEMTYDVWVNGIGWDAPGHTEFMVWVDNFGQTPLGGKPMLTKQSVGGGTYDVWYYSYSGGNQVISFVADTNFSSGTVDLMSFFKYAMNKGWLTSNAAIDQIGFGPEIVSTQTPPNADNGTNATFFVDDFTLTCSPSCL